MIPNGLSFYGCEIPHRLHACELHFEQGQFWHVLGANGSGKSTLLLALGGLLPHSKLIYNQKNIESLSLVQQSHIRSLLSQQHPSEFEVSIQQLLFFFTKHNCLPEELESALELNTFLSKPLNKLSGGQQQRFHIARSLLQIWCALGKGEGILILDEPLQGLDVKHQLKVINLLKGICSQGNLVIMSCHDISLSLNYASHVCMLKNGNVVKQGKAQSCLTSECLSEVFDIAFIDSNGVPSFQSSLN